MMKFYFFSVISWFCFCVTEVKVVSPTKWVSISTVSGNLTNSSTGSSTETSTGSSTETSTGSSTETLIGSSTETSTGSSMETSTGSSMETSTGSSMETSTGSSVLSSTELEASTQINREFEEVYNNETATDIITVVNGDVLWTTDTRVDNSSASTGHYELNMEVNKSSVTGNITWKFTTENTVNLQVTLQQEIVKTLPQYSTIHMRVNTSCDKNDFQCGNRLNVTHGPIVVIETESQESQYFQTPVIAIKFNREQYLLDSKGRWHCGYWSPKDNRWKDDGLTTESNIQFITCLSTHLTAFSVLLDPYFLLHPEKSEADDKVLTAISVAGSIVTIPCLLLTIGTYCWKKKRPDNETTKILIHECVALLLTHTSYHIYHWFGERVNCRIINFLTHYSVAAFLLWTACDGVNMWRILLNDVFNTRGHVFYRGYKVVSWGMPLLTTTIGTLITGDHTTAKCQLHFDRLCEIILYIVPCTLIFCCNASLFTWMLVNVVCKDSLGRLKSKKVEFLVALAQVFSIGWCIAFPLLWFSRTRLIGQYLFAVLVSTQGVLIFMVRCVPNVEFKKAMSTCWCSHSAASYSPTRATLSSSIKLSSDSSQLTARETKNFRYVNVELKSSIVTK